MSVAFCFGAKDKQKTIGTHPSPVTLQVSIGLFAAQRDSIPLSCLDLRLLICSVLREDGTGIDRDDQ